MGFGNAEPSDYEKQGVLDDLIWGNAILKLFDSAKGCDVAQDKWKLHPLGQIILHCPEWILCASYIDYIVHGVGFD